MYTVRYHAGVGVDKAGYRGGHACTITIPPTLAIGFGYEIEGFMSPKHKTKNTNSLP